MVLSSVDDLVSTHSVAHLAFLRRKNLQRYIWILQHPTYHSVGAFPIKTPRLWTPIIVGVYLTPATAMVIVMALNTDVEERPCTLGRRHFFQLPRELRDKIYTYLLLSRNPIRIRKYTGPGRETDPTILRVSRQLRNEATPIYYRINEFLYTQLETDYFCESMTRAEAAYMKHISLRIHSGFTEASYRLQLLERLLSSLLELECLKMTISLEACRIYSARGQEPEKGNRMAIAVDLENALPAPTSEGKKWIRRWVVDTTNIHFWYVPREFKMTRWVSFVFHLASRVIADARPRT
jgi:hypothetical protein